MEKDTQMLTSDFYLYTIGMHTCISLFICHTHTHTNTQIHTHTQCSRYIKATDCSVVSRNFLPKYSWKAEKANSDYLFPREIVNYLCIWGGGLNDRIMRPSLIAQIYLLFVKGTSAIYYNTWEPLFCAVGSKGLKNVSTFYCKEAVL